MENPSLFKSIIITGAILYVFCPAGPLFAKDKWVDPADAGISATMHKQAEEYRNTGLEYQRTGDLDMAVSLYQKALAVDPGYGIVYNDLG
ncbi:hypothetical protein EPN54_03570, partial [bacterium]